MVPAGIFNTCEVSRLLAIAGCGSLKPRKASPLLFADDLREQQQDC